MGRQERAFEPPHKYDPSYLIGDDLSPEMLDELYRFWDEMGGETDNHMGYWWKDKAHQIGRRLLMRLTRAEVRIKELEAELAALKSSG